MNYKDTAQLRRLVFTLQLKQVPIKKILLLTNIKPRKCVNC